MKKILLIEQDKNQQELVLKTFPKNHYRVIAANDGIEGLQKCRNEEFDLIILEFHMSKVDGVRFYNQVREMQEVRRSLVPPMIFLIDSIEESKLINVKLERCEYLEKSYEVQELLGRVNRIFNPSTKDQPVKSDKLILNPGEILFDEGDPPHSIFLIVSGRLGAYRKMDDGQFKCLTTYGTGEVIGEVGVLIGDQRIARAVAEEKTELISVPSDKILSLVEAQPKWIRLMLEGMSRRLQESVKLIS